MTVFGRSKALLSWLFSSPRVWPQSTLLGPCELCRIPSPKETQMALRCICIPGTHRRMRFPLFVCPHVCGLSDDARWTFCRFVAAVFIWCRFLLSVLCFVVLLSCCLLCTGNLPDFAPQSRHVNQPPSLARKKRRGWHKLKRRSFIAKTKLHSTLRVLNPKLTEEYVHRDHVYAYSVRVIVARCRTPRVGYF